MILSQQSGNIEVVFARRRKLSDQLVPFRFSDCVQRVTNNDMRLPSETREEHASVDVVIGDQWMSECHCTVTNATR